MHEDYNGKNVQQVREHRIACALSLAISALSALVVCFALYGLYWAIMQPGSLLEFLFS